LISLINLVARLRLTTVAHAALDRDTAAYDVLDIFSLD
jgi:hypothetical protein